MDSTEEIKREKMNIRKACIIEAIKLKIHSSEFSKKSVVEIAKEFEKFILKEY